MPHVYSLDGEHFSKGLSVSCEILPRITVILQEMGAESVLHLRPLPERHFGLLAQPMQPCSPTSMLGGVQPSGGIPLVMVLQRMGRRGLQTSSYWSKTPKCREFYKICASVHLHSCSALENAMESAPGRCAAGESHCWDPQWGEVAPSPGLCNGAIYRLTQSFCEAFWECCNPGCSK